MVCLAVPDSVWTYMGHFGGVEMLSSHRLVHGASKCNGFCSGTAPETPPPGPGAILRPLGLSIHQHLAIKMMVHAPLHYYTHQGPPCTIVSIILAVTTSQTVTICVISGPFGVVCDLQTNQTQVSPAPNGPRRAVRSGAECVVPVE